MDAANHINLKGVGLGWAKAHPFLSQATADRSQTTPYMSPTFGHGLALLGPCNLARVPKLWRAAAVLDPHLTFGGRETIGISQGPEST